MITVTDRIERSAAARPRWSVVAVAGSLGLHVGLVLLILRGSPRMPDTQPPIEVEFLDEAAQVRGGAVPAGAAAAPAVERDSDGPPAPAAASAGSTRAASGPEINLGNGARDALPLFVTGEGITPAAPDSRYRNQPPGYPAGAAKIGAEGIVGLVIHVTAAGLPSDVAVAQSSGYEVLDNAARRAVLLWRFQPARSGGRAVAFDYTLNIRFTMGEHR